MKIAVVDGLSCLAGIAAATGDVVRAARLAAAVAQHSALIASYPTVASAGFERADIEKAKATCDPEAWEQAWAAGRAMPLDQAAEYALSSD